MAGPQASVLLVLATCVRCPCPSPRLTRPACMTVRLWLFTCMAVRLQGAAFLWAAPEQQAALLPLVTSHGAGLGFVGEFLWQV